MVSEGPINGHFPPYLGHMMAVGACAKDLFTSKWEKVLEIRYNFQKHMPSNLLIPTRPC
jgi:hypothetical protein